MAQRKRARKKSGSGSKTPAPRKRAPAAKLARRPAKSARGSAKARKPAEAQGKAPARRARKKAPSRRIDIVFKGIVALEPPRDNSLANLHPEFRARLRAVLNDLAAQGTGFKFVEGFRTMERQQWLFGSGRPSAVPFGRAGKIVTHRDGVKKLSEHQGDGTAGSCRAADCYPLRNGQVHIPPASDPVWRAYADAVVRQGMRAGLDFPSLKDAPHCELA